MSDKLKKNLNNHKLFFENTSIYFIILYLTLILLDITKILVINNHLNLTIFCIITSLFVLISQLAFKQNKNLVKYSFLIFLILITINSLELNFLKNFKELIQPYAFQFIIATITLGIITLVQNKEVIYDLENEKKNEILEEEKRKEEFDEKFKKLTLFNLKYNIKENFLKKKYFVALIRIFLLPFIFIARLPYSIIKKIYTKGIKFSLYFLIIITTFFIMQIYKITHTGIGTDEGNFIYTVKQIFEGKQLFIDFWSRESGSLLLLIPWFKIFNISLFNYRVLILLINFAILILFYLILNEFLANKKQTSIVLLTSLLVLQFNSEFNMYQGIFYKLNSLFSILLIFLWYKHIYKNDNNINLFYISLITGIGILCYKGIQIFLIIIPITLIILNKEFLLKLKKILIFFLGSIIPILTYWTYYAIPTSFNHIYQIILKDVIFNWSSLFITFIAFILLLKNHIHKIIQKEILVWLSNALFIFVSIYLLLNTDNFFFSIYSGIYLAFPFFLILIQTLNLTNITKSREILTGIYIIQNTCVLILGYGSRGFFTYVPNFYHLFTTLFIISYNIYLFLLIFKENPNVKLAQEKNWIFIFIINIWISISIIGGYLIPTRFQTALIFLPILLILFLRIKANYKIALYIFLIVGIIFSIFLNSTLQNDFTLYSQKELSDTIKYINSLNEPTIFSADTSILSFTNITNLVSFSSPFHFREEKDIYFYEDIEKYNTDLSLNKSQIMDKISDKKVRYIIGSWRSTLRIFDKEYLDNNFKVKKNFGRILIYEKK